jgi:hypothetical protein
MGAPIPEIMDGSLYSIVLPSYRLFAVDKHSTKRNEFKSIAILFIAIISISMSISTGLENREYDRRDPSR